MGNYGLASRWGKYKKHKFRAIADGMVAKIGETDK